MSSIRITGYCGLIIRRAALLEKNVTIEAVINALENAAPLDMDEELISIGPCFGGESLNEYTKRLADIGLVFFDVFFDDFFDLVFDSPPWCTFRAELSNES